MARKETGNDGLSLTYKQRLFVSYYLGEAKGNATEAARMAGYAHPNKQGPALLVNVGIRSAIDSRLADVALSADEILARLAEHATGDMADFLAVKKVTVEFDFAKARRNDKLRLIKKMTIGKRGVTMEMYDSHAALVQLGKYHGLFDKPDMKNLPDESLGRFDAIPQDRPGGTGGDRTEGGGAAGD